MTLDRRIKAEGLPTNFIFDADVDGHSSGPSKAASTRGYRARSINLSTVHSAKGLGAPRVFIIEVTPRHGVDQAVHLQEHRNLAYVALTRASEGVTFLRQR